MPETSCGFGDIPGGSSGSELLVVQGPTILVNIGFDFNWKPTDPPTIPVHGISGIRGLVDTGAAISCIDDLLAVQLNLPKIDERHIGGSGGKHLASIYLAQVYIPSLEITLYGQFAGVHLTAGGQIHQALLGRPFLRSINMTYDGTTGMVILKSQD